MYQHMFVIDNLIQIHINLFNYLSIKKNLDNKMYNKLLNYCHMSYKDFNNFRIFVQEKQFLRDNFKDMYFQIMKNFCMKYNLQLSISKLNNLLNKELLILKYLHNHQVCSLNIDTKEKLIQDHKLYNYQHLNNLSILYSKQHMINMYYYLLHNRNQGIMLNKLFNMNMGKKKNMKYNYRLVLNKYRIKDHMKHISY